MQLAVLAGDFLLSRACVALAALKNTEVFPFHIFWIIVRGKLGFHSP